MFEYVEEGVFFNNLVVDNNDDLNELLYNSRRNCNDHGWRSSEWLQRFNFRFGRFGGADARSRADT